MNFLTHLSFSVFHLVLTGAGIFLVVCAVLAFIGWAGPFLVATFYPVYFVTLKPFVWAIQKLFQSRCPQCKGFFKRKMVDYDISDEREVLRTINRVDQGTLFSRTLFEPNQTIEINRQEQVVFVEKTILNHWACKDPLCDHKWTTEEIIDHEGSLT